VASVTGVRQAVSTQPVRRPGSGCPAVWCPHVRCPVTRVRRPGSGCPTGCCPPVRCPALCCPPVQRPAAWCPPLHRSGRVRLLPPPAVAVGTRSRRPGNRHHRNGSRSPWAAAALERLSRRPSSPDGGRRRRGRALVSGGCRWRTPARGCGRAAAAALARCAARQARPACGASVAGGGTVGRGAGPARAGRTGWLASSGWVGDHGEWWSWRRPVGVAICSGSRRGWGCGPSAAQAGSGRSRLAAGSAVTCGDGWWACQDLNLGPHPYQLNAGNRCADRRFPRSRPTVGAEGIGSICLLVCVLNVQDH
jgi:hypothetical protein